MGENDTIMSSVLCLIKHHTMKMYQRMCCALLILALDEGEWSDSYHDHFIAKERIPDTKGEETEWTQELIWM
jgi:hypothetical protein